LTEKRRSVGCGAIASLFFAATLVSWIWWYSTLITEAQENQLRHGMTQEEVLEILGPPHFKTSSDPEYFWAYKCNYPSVFSDPMGIQFDENKRVKSITR
jgi:outer membrane protein assembly factor BamE (lipoprotein component of BamABCDE complex)